MEGKMKEIIGVLILVVIGWAFFPVISNSIVNAELFTVLGEGTDGEQEVDLNWLGYLALLFYGLAITFLPLGLLYAVIKTK